MQRSKLDTILYSTQNVVVYQDRLSKLLAAVDDSVANCVDVPQSSDFGKPRFVGSDPLKNFFQCGPIIFDRESGSLGNFTFRNKSKNSRPTNSLDLSVNQSPVSIALDRLQIS